MKEKTVCWNCKKATSRYECPWAGGEPRDDWDAVSVERVWYDNDHRPHIQHSFLVRKCPGFKEDERGAKG